MKQHEFVVVANRLPVNAHKDEDGSTTFERAPGGLVSALAPMMSTEGGAWVGWAGAPDEEFAPFNDEGIDMIPVSLTQTEVETYYEGFSNTTLWPLYHDVIVAPEYHREWWTTYRAVNERFAHATSQVAAHGATVWVHDYQLQLVPNMLREARPDLKIGFFLHIPFPPRELFGQLSWREDILRGLLGADLIGFQRSWDADNFLRSVRQFSGLGTRGMVVNTGAENRSVRAGVFPISLDSREFNTLARSRSVLQRAKQIRADLGNPEKVLLGVDRLDYTKGIRHRLKAYGELFEEDHLKAGEVAMVQVASPSREKVEEYIHLRSEVEETVGRINGDYGELGQPVIHYLHQSYPWEEMAAMYR
ncbi:MAG TPA: trehalose-6-phosphate synthase, partial [Beutenbergiaceae bacterium]|nr:trehalose-6-phosphate synthase [Beutenbergiaceae bacterium]